MALGLLTIYAALAYYLVALDVTLSDLGSPSVDDRSGRLLHSLAFAAFGLSACWVLDVEAQSGSAGLFTVWLVGFLGFVTVSATVDQEDSPNPGALSRYIC